MSEKPVTERLSIVENDIEHIKTTLDKIQGSISDLHNDIHNTQTQHNANIIALRDEVLQNIEAHRNQTSAEFKKAEKESRDYREKSEKDLKEFREKSEKDLKEFREKTEESFKEVREKSEKDMKEFREKTDEGFKEVRKEMAAGFERIENQLAQYSKENRETQARHEAVQFKFNAELEGQKRDLRWIIVIGLAIFGATVADANGWFGLIGKLFTGG